MIEAIEQAARGEASAEPSAQPPPNAPNAQPEQPALPIDWSTEPAPVAANGIQVLHTPHQFAVLFTDMAMFPGRNAADGRTGSERARVVSSMRIDPETYFQALCVMASNWNKFVETNVPKQMRQPRFKLLDAGELQLYGIKPPKPEED
ncbi:MAG: hypothetical protein AB7S26_31675 [Sandaracinaceae bacterium]